MDIFAHGLWTGAAARYANHKKATERRVNPWLAAFWGVVPDLFAFTIPFIAMIWALTTGDMQWSDFGPPEDSATGERPSFALSHSLYNISHSAVTFAAAFGLVWLFRKRPQWEMLGWLLHIMIDIPTHSAEFFPTPLFWPISAWKFLSGFSWGVWWFMIANYTALGAAYFWLWRKEKAETAL